jgi:hypothetical protein|nr:MAG TPA: Protein involved in gliding motility 9 Secretion System Type.5A [Bacteriophage sp.]DAT98761.1 MAG TPA: Protein involved in gliding motility 9 Secretion System Type.5A [Caudoviricetes sp.]DAX96385.1 MAG TPA: Protein involved in gliding motility 9 Secretion System Type.5A [Caudoviricetes sp.]
MRKLTLLLLAFLALVGCRTRKVITTEQRQVQKERIIKYKDSTQLFAYNSHSSQFSHSSQENYELELETLTDSVGKPRELIYTRIRDGDNEVIRVLNGKVKLRATSTHSKSLQQADSTLYNNSYTRTKAEVQKHAYTQVKQVSKQVKSSPVRHTLWLLLIAVLVFIIWKFKPFRWKI